MSFLHLWALPIGAAALAAPLIIHLLTRPKPTRLPLSTIRFVQQVVEQRRARQRLRDWLILALRTAAVAFDRYGKDIHAWHSGRATIVARPKAVKIVRCWKRECVLDDTTF